MPRLEPERLLDDLDPEQREAVARDERTGRDPRRRGHRQDAGDQPANGVRDRDRGRARRTRCSSSRSPTRPRARWSSGCGRSGCRASPRGRSTPTRSASSGIFWPSRHDGAAAARAARLEAADPRPARAAAARPLSGSRRRRTWPTRSSGRSRGGSGRASTSARWPGSRRGASRRSRSTCSSARSRTTSARRPAQGRIDFDDLLVETVRLLEDDVDAAETVRARKRWFSVDEYQDTSPLQQRLLELWLGDRPDVCVVGDVDQTIYTFTGASSDYLTTFADRHPGARLARPDAELPLDAAGPRAGQPADRGRRPVEAAVDEPRGRAAADDHEVRRRLGRGGRDGRRDPRPLRERRRAGRDRRARPDERPDRAHRGGADRGRHRVPGARHPVLRPAGGQGGDLEPATAGAR